MAFQDYDFLVKTGWFQLVGHQEHYAYLTAREIVRRTIVPAAHSRWLFVYAVFLDSSSSYPNLMFRYE